MMRLISQDGTQDYPYEQAIVTLFHSDYSDGYLIYAKSVSSVANYGEKFARYSTEKQAKAALREMLLEFTRNSVMFDGYNYPKVFRFPADNETEVNNDDNS